MVSRVAAAVVAGMIALSATPAIAQVKEEQKPDQTAEMKKLETELARLKAVEANLQAQMKLLRAELGRESKLERIEKSKTELKLDDLKKAQAEFDRAAKIGDNELKRAQIEFEKTLEFQEKPRKLEEKVEKVQRLRDELNKFAQIEKERASKLQDELTRQAQKEVDRLIELQLGEGKPRVLVLGAADKQPVPYEKMSAEELKQVITKLQILLEEKTRGKPGAEKIKPASGAKGKPGGEKVKPSAGSQDEILKRLDMLTKEVEELRRAIKK